MVTFYFRKNDHMISVVVVRFKRLYSSHAYVYCRIEHTRDIALPRDALIYLVSTFISISFTDYTITACLFSSLFLFGTVSFKFISLDFYASPDQGNICKFFLI